jgi:hypothetical protein
METAIVRASPPTSAPARAPRAVMTIERLVEKHELAKAKKRAGRGSARLYAAGETLHAARKKAAAMARYHDARPLARYNNPQRTRVEMGGNLPDPQNK